MSRKPNIVIFNPDQYRSDALGHLGNEAVNTPNLDRMIEKDAVSFANAFCQNPVCTPSRCSFMSGWYPHVRGHRTMYHMMHEGEPVLLKILKDNGYFVWWGGKNDLVPGQGSFEQYCDVKYKPGETEPGLHGDLSWRGEKGSDNYYSFYAGKLDTGQNDVYYDGDWAYIDGAIDFIKGSSGDEPFCVYLPLLYPHPPYGVEEPWYSSTDRDKILARINAPENWDDKPGVLGKVYQRQELQNWTEDRWTELRATYLGMCSRIDYQFGLIVDALKEAGIYDDTAIFFFSDHGDFTGDYGLVEKTQNTFEDCLTNVPFIIKPPADIKTKTGVRDSLVELIDFPATVEELTGIDFDYTHFGSSLLSVISGESDKHRDAVFCEGGRLKDETHCMELKSSSSNDPEGLYWPRSNLQQSIPEHTKAVMVRTDRYKYVRRLYEKDELYDLLNDPQELNNVIDSREMRSVLNELKDRLVTFYLETGDVVPHQTDER